jgi:expansin (peptidoglycan-binding protein)
MFPSRLPKLFITTGLGRIMSATLNRYRSVARRPGFELARGLLLAGNLLALAAFSGCSSSDSGAGTSPGISPFESATNPGGSVAAGAPQNPAQCVAGAQSNCSAQTCTGGSCQTAEGVSTIPLSPNQGATTPTPATSPTPTQTTTMTASTQACMPSAVTCNSANVIRTCSADGSSFTDARCADGTVCQGAGQCMPVKCDASKLLSHNGNGQVTVYWFAQGTLASPPQAGQDVNCSLNASRANNDDNGQADKVAYIQDPSLFGAMNLSEYNGAAACGACVEMTQGGRSVTLTIADSCNPAINNNGSCTSGHIDMSRTAFQQLTGQSTGNIGGITWKIVPCDHVGKVQFLLKKPDDMYWNQFLVLNHRYPIVKAEVLMKDGRWVQATREDYNYWLPPEGAGPGGDMGTYRVRVTDVNGAIVEEQLALQGGLQGGSGQFDCQP